MNIDKDTKELKRKALCRRLMLFCFASIIIILFFAGFIKSGGIAGAAMYHFRKDILSDKI